MKLFALNILKGSSLILSSLLPIHLKIRLFKSLTPKFEGSKTL